MKKIYLCGLPFFVSFYATAMELTKEEKKEEASHITNPQIVVLKNEVESFFTDRMVAHRIQEKDLDNLYSLLSNPEVGKTVMGGVHTLDKTKEVMELLINRWVKHGYGSWMFHDKNTGEFIGRAGLHPSAFDGKDEIVVSCAIMPHYWNKGFATEMGQALKKVGFEKLTFESIVAFTQPTNTASQKAIAKNGFTFERSILEKTGPYKDLELLFYRLKRLESNNKSHQSDWNGEKYDKNSSLQYKRGVEAIESFGLKGDERVLDIGCGNGKTTALCADRLKSGSLIAIDSSASMIEFAQKNHGSIANLRFMVQDVISMTFDQEFDLVYSIFCLHWVKDQEIAMKNIAKAIKPGGKAVLYISLPNETHKAFEEELDKLVNESDWRAYKNKIAYNYFAVNKEVWFKYAEQNNLSVSFKTIHDETIYDDYQKFRHRVTSYGVCCEIIQILGQQLGDKFVDSYLEGIYKHLGLTIDQPITWKSDAVVLTLIK